MRIAVIGAGAWGTALANLLSENEHEVQLWAYEPDVAESVNGANENRRFLGGVPLHRALRATNAIEQSLEGAEMAFFVAPSHVLRGVAASAARHTPAHIPLVVATKGIDRERLSLMTDVVGEEIAGRPLVALSGPSFALEVANHLPTAVVAASDDPEAAVATQRVLSTSAFRVYTQGDVTGVELGGALKNVMAVATGISDGLNLGFNARAALITRGLAEMTRLGVKLGADPATFAGLAGVGDLVLTCTGSLSRNRSVASRSAAGQP